MTLTIHGVPTESIKMLGNCSLVRITRRVPFTEGMTYSPSRYVESVRCDVPGWEIVVQVNDLCPSAGKCIKMDEFIKQLTQHKDDAFNYNTHEFGYNSENSVINCTINIVKIKMVQAQCAEPETDPSRLYFEIDEINIITNYDDGEYYLKFL